MTKLVGTDPFSLDRPSAKALMVWIVAGEVAVLDQPPPSMAAVKVDDFVLRRSKYRALSDHNVELTWHMVSAWS